MRLRLTRLLRPLTLAVGLVAVLAAAPAVEAGCAVKDVEGARVCADADPSDGRAGVRADRGGVKTGLAAEYGAGFFGNYVYVIGTHELGNKVHTHGGLGLADRDLDGVYEDACVCGAVQSVVFVPWGVGVEDTDDDGMPDQPYVLPRLA